VRLVVPSGDTQTSPNPSPILISRGDVNVSGVNFVLTRAQQGRTASVGQETSGFGGSWTDLAPDATVIDALFAATGGRIDWGGVF
jgi:hypothetical protein